MASEYDPVLAGGAPADDADLEAVRDHFAAASRPYLSSPWSWLAWAVVLPAAALATPVVIERWRAAGGLFLWSAAILAGGAVEMLAITRQKLDRTALGGWAMRIQGNLSLVGLALSVLLLWRDLAWALPGLWLLLLGHSFYLLGGLAFPPLRRTGLIYQFGGILALWPRGQPLWVFAAVTAIANLALAVSIWRTRRDE